MVIRHRIFARIRILIFDESTFFLSKVQFFDQKRNFWIFSKKICTKPVFWYYNWFDFEHWSATLCFIIFVKKYFLGTSRCLKVHVKDSETLFLRNEKYKMLRTIFLLWNAVKSWSKLGCFARVIAKNRQNYHLLWR